MRASWQIAVATATATAIIALVISRRRRKRSAVPLAFSSCVTHTLTSSDGLRYKLIVSLPHDYDPASRYPLILALDAEPYLFPLLTVVARTNKFFARSYYYSDTIRAN